MSNATHDIAFFEAATLSQAEVDSSLLLPDAIRWGWMAGKPSDDDRALHTQILCAHMCPVDKCESSIHRVAGMYMAPPLSEDPFGWLFLATPARRRSHFYS